MMLKPDTHDVLKCLYLQVCMMFTLLVWAANAQVERTKTRCAAPQVYNGETAAVTCVFSKDISQITKDFTVHFIKQGSKGVDVLDCFWLNKMNISCKTDDGFSFDEKVSDQLTMVIKKATEDYVGIYKCLVEGTDPTDITECEFNLKYGVKPEIQTTVSTTSLSSAGPVTNKTDQPKGPKSGSTVAIVLPVIVLVVLCVGVAAALYYKRGRGREHFQRFRERFPNVPIIGRSGHPTAEHDASNAPEGVPMTVMNDAVVVVSDSDEGSEEEFVLASEQLTRAENEMTVLLVPPETNAASPGSQQDTPFAQGNSRPPSQADETLTGTAESKTGTTTEGSEVTGARSEHENSRTDE